MTVALLEELAAAGYVVSSVSELRESGVRYRAAIPVLVNGLVQCDDVREREGIVRALSVPWARDEALGPLIAEFKSAQERWGPAGEGLAWAVGNALEVLADDSMFPELVELASDSRYGRARQMIVLALGKSKRPEAVQVLMGLVDDPEVDGHAISALAKLKAPAAREAFESKLDDERAWVRREARKALTKLPG
jgi:HEAT repeat protein